MTATHAAPDSARIDEFRRAWRAANITPLWETTSVGPKADGPKGYLWKWKVLRPLVDNAVEATTLANAERRVLCLSNPDAVDGRNTTTNLSACLQVLMPGESARPHRHTPNALRFVLEGSGATTIVDGKHCPMSEGDLILTPGWCWHQHTHAGSAPIVWLDALDVPLHHYLGTGVFEPGPPKDVLELPDDSAFATPNIVPELPQTPEGYSPVFRYPRAASMAALKSAPLAKDGSRKVRYVNPLNGGSAMSLVDCSMTKIDAGKETIPYRTTSNSVCVVVEGSGSSRVGNETFQWEPRDIFSMPHGNWITHRCDSDGAILFVVSDREVLRRLDLLVDEYGNERR